LRKIEVGPYCAHALLRIEKTLNYAYTYRVAEGLEDIGPFGVILFVHGNPIW